MKRGDLGEAIRMTETALRYQCQGFIRRSGKFQRDPGEHRRILRSLVATLRVLRREQRRAQVRAALRDGASGLCDDWGDGTDTDAPQRREQAEPRDQEPPEHYTMPPGKLAARYRLEKL